MTGKGVGNGERLGAVLGKIPAASAGMTEVGREYDGSGARVRRGRGAGVAGGGVGNDERLGAVLGEIPLFGPGAGSAASAGMTEMGVRVWREGGVGMAEVGVRVWRERGVGMAGVGTGFAGQSKAFRVRGRTAPYLRRSAMVTIRPVQSGPWATIQRQASDMMIGSSNSIALACSPSVKA